MSIGSFFGKLLHHPATIAAASAAVDAAKVEIAKGVSAAVPAAKAFARNELTKVAEAAKDTPVGTALVNAAQAIESSTLSGPEKAAQVIENVAPLALDIALKGGFTGILADVKPFLATMLEMVLADTRATKAVKVGEAIVAAAKAA